MTKCDYKECEADATTKGYVYGHVTGSNEKDTFLPVNACDKHKNEYGFFEESNEHA